MPDYGHELMLGTFITPTVHDPGRVLRVAELTETSNLDIATFQDHPYNADFLDTYTLLTWVAAKTAGLSERHEPSVASARDACTSRRQS
ncbi:hypothetical protein [Streptomyces sp. NPDC051098]|uniref:hypothetical protein n=1 Tax=Streptomyces sp. NPDC051098 TaxID=3155411 RepID=UPI0034445BE8